jgi:2-C-methyl-D-erythritol 4-phosphate cytidylyltransferase
MRTVAVVLAGGTGRRFGAAGETGTGRADAGGAGSSLPKQLLVLAGTTLLERSVAAFDAAPGVDEVLVVMAAGFTELATQVLGAIGYRKLTGVIEGGAARADSTRRAITALSGAAGGDRNVLFHDAARPLVDQRIIADCVTALGSWQAVGVVVPASDTMVEMTDGAITRVLPRQSLARCQTPQGFRLSVISRAHELAAADPAFTEAAATDDCGVVVRYLPDVTIRAVSGSQRNLKITYPSDLAVAEALLRS